jgi:tetratricopeptide (TPR) repeat protein
LWNKYALDDTAVITENKYTLQGLAGIPDIMTHDASVGYLGDMGNDLFSGGRYRPLSIATMAAEIEFFGQDPMVSHGINVFLFALTCLLLYHILSITIPVRPYSSVYLSVPFIAAMLFAGHPVHVEAVANIKGRDEIMGLLFSLLALYAALAYVRTQSIFHLIWGAMVYFLALMSKESAVTFLAVIPLTFYFFTGARPPRYFVTISCYLIPIAVFLILRGIYTKSGLWNESSAIFNNPFALLPKDADGYMQRYATVVMVFILYFKLLIFPHPLTHDYYYDQIPFIGIGHPLFIFSLSLNIALIVYALMTVRKKTIPSYAILFYFITFSVVSNVVFNIGMLMNERFMYVSSIGFCLLLAFLAVKAAEKCKHRGIALPVLLFIILVMYSIKTISRNTVWKDNQTLILTDIWTSTHSAKINNTAGGMLLDLSGKDFQPLRHDGSLQRAMTMLKMNEEISMVPDSVLRRQLMEASIKYFKISSDIYPENPEVWFGLGTALSRLGMDPNEALRDYQKAETLGYRDLHAVWNNAGILELSYNNPGPAKINFIKALRINPGDISCWVYLARAYMALGQPDSSVYCLKKALELNPNDAGICQSIGRIYGIDLKEYDSAIDYFTRAIRLDPDLVDAYNDLSIAYHLSGRDDKAIAISEGCLDKFPNYVPALINLAALYRGKKDIAKAEMYEARISALDHQTPVSSYK